MHSVVGDVSVGYCMCIILQVCTNFQLVSCCSLHSFSQVQMLNAIKEIFLSGGNNYLYVKKKIISSLYYFHWQLLLSPSYPLVFLLVNRSLTWDRCGLYRCGDLANFPELLVSITVYVHICNLIMYPLFNPVLTRINLIPNVP